MSNWTVTIAGAERHDGESPYLWVVTAESADQAAEKALAIHRREMEDNDLEVRAVMPSIPPEGRGTWNDRRDPLPIEPVRVTIETSVHESVMIEAALKAHGKRAGMRESDYTELAERVREARGKVW